MSLKTRSQCADCGKVLAWYELVPLVSFVFQRGRCRHCGKRLSWRYPIVELLTATVFALIVAKYGIDLQSVLLLVIASILLVIAFIDWETQLIPDQLSVAALIVSALFVALEKSVGDGLLGALIGAGILGFIVLVTKGKGMGIGDIKLGGVLSLSLGWPSALLALFTAFVSGAVFGLTLLVRGRALMKTAVPFGPFLILGWLVAMVWGEQLIAWYTGY